MKKVIIGIVSKHYPKEKYSNLRTDVFIRDEVKQAIFDNGGIAIGILPVEEKIKYVGDNWKNDLLEPEYNNLTEQINICDGIIFQGGMESDNYEVIAAKYCYGNNIPTLGICCGQNIIVRAIGGSTKYISKPHNHMKVNSEYVHKVFVDKNSKFYNIIGKEEFMVNSRHNKIIKDCPRLDIVGICEDGYSDVVESKDKDFYIGLRFHPESLYKTDENMNKIFKEFINVCKSKSRLKSKV